MFPSPLPPLRGFRIPWLSLWDRWLLYQIIPLLQITKSYTRRFPHLGPHTQGFPNSSALAAEFWKRTAKMFHNRVFPKLYCRKSGKCQNHCWIKLQNVFGNKYSSCSWYGYFTDLNSLSVSWKIIIMILQTFHKFYFGKTRTWLNTEFDVWRTELCDGENHLKKYHKQQPVRISILSQQQ